MVNLVGGTFQITYPGFTGATASAAATPPGFQRDYWPFSLFGPLTVVLTGQSSYYVDWL
jgi:hypothetical protein